MNKAELKKILRPLIKECIKEVIFEDGTLSTIISEVMKGTSHQQPIMRESKQRVQFESGEQEKTKRLQIERNRKESHKKLLDSIGRDAYNGVDLFEGTAPLSNRNSGSKSTPHGSQALDGVDPRDPGVDISAFTSTGIWKKLAGS